MVGDATTNIIEGSHANVNLEGVRCTLLGGLRKGEHWDDMKLKGLEVGFYYHCLLQQRHADNYNLRPLKLLVFARVISAVALPNLRQRI